MTISNAIGAEGDEAEAAAGYAFYSEIYATVIGEPLTRSKHSRDYLETLVFAN